MGQPVEVVVSELHSASAGLADAAQRLQDGLTSVNTETTELLGSGWKGGAAAAYAPVWEQWNEGAKKVVEGLQRMSELLDIAGNEYAKTDESAAAGVDSTMQGSAGPSGIPGAGTATTGSPGTSGAAGSSGATDGAGQASSSVTQLPQAVGQSFSQAGQAVAGLVQTAAQLASGVAQRVGQADAEEDGEQDGDEKADGASAGGEQNTGTAPVETEEVDHAEAARAVERPSD